MNKAKALSICSENPGRSIIIIDGNSTKDFPYITSIGGIKMFLYDSNRKCIKFLLYIDTNMDLYIPKKLDGLVDGYAYDE